MRKLVACIILFSSFVMVGYSQVKDEDTLLNIMQQQAMKMAQALLKEDYRAFTKFTYPKLVQISGGYNEMATLIEKEISGMKKQGFKIDDIKVDSPSHIFRNGKELQCTVLQHLYMTVQSKKVMSTSSLIAFSSDNGLNWTFLDANNKPIETIKKIAPNLSSQIVIPKQRPPVELN
ncbi:hypothetical protein [Pinibacter aurantiacus]|uniref:DUF4440 domain-containing protein n=1 Tax=Pinibacter aurantiacus TaxID=2851599 RepID=A0A9E2SCY0_9BACT|nr:hypothetical protein [Pinibacter aurantiacus]MBV4358993.1 hypothetical protein [Pinibacter aurantiacus]